MNKFLLSLFTLLILSGNSWAAILVMSPNGTYTTKATLSAAATAADAAGKTIVVTSALSAVQSNISSATVHKWPADRVLRREKGGTIGNTTKFDFTGASTDFSGDYQVFAGAGAVTGLKEVYAEWFGASTSNADNGPAFQRAFSASKKVILGSDGTYTFTSGFLFAKQGCQLLGKKHYLGGAGTILKYTSTTGALLTTGAYDGVNDYVSTPSGQGYTLKDVQLEGVYDARDAGTSAYTPVGILDMEGGSGILDNVVISKFKFGFWGIGADFMDINNALVTYCDTGVALYGRSDQARFTNLYAYGNNTAVLLTKVVNITFDNARFVDNFGPDVKITTGNAAPTHPVTGAAYDNIGTGTFGVVFNSPWFEVYNDKGWTVTIPKSCFIEVGITNSVQSNPPSRGVQVNNADIVCTNSKVVDAVVKTQWAESVAVDGITYQTNYVFPVIMSLEASTYTPSSSVTQKPGSGLSVRRWSIPQPQNPSTAIASAIEGMEAPDIDLAGVAQVPIVNNPLLYGTAYGWAKNGADTYADYTAGAEEVLFGSAIKYTPGAQFRQLYQDLKLSSRTYTAYRVRIRYRTDATDTQAFTFGIQDNNSVPNGTWQRYLRGRTTFGEVSFVINNYGTSLATPRIVLNYSGTDAPNDWISVDYIDVQEIVRGGLVSGGVTILHGTATPTAGAWRVGDRIINSSPTVGQPQGWVCTVAGTPGTWVSEGNL